MTGALPSIILALLLGASSLVLVLYRVSPLTASEFAVSFFFLSIFITVTAFTTLILILVKGLLVRQPFRPRTFIVPSLRQGIFAALGTCLIILLHLLQILNWWIALLIYAVFVLIEMAVGG